MVGFRMLSMILLQRFQRENEILNPSFRFARAGNFLQGGVDIKMKKRFCDFCGNDITNDCIFIIEFYDEIAEKTILEKEACEDCNKVILDFVKNKIPFGNLSKK